MSQNSGLVLTSPPTRSVATDFLLRFVGVQLIALILAVVLVLAGYSTVARQYVKSQAIQFMDVMLSVREYTSRKVNPILAPINAVSDEAFLPAAVPSYSATKVFEYLKLNHAYEDFQYREASLNPTSPADLADDEEAMLIRRFIDDPSLKELSGSLKTSSDHHQYFVAKPIRLSKESCLVCHSTPERAPRSQLRVYGRKGGFGWKVGDVVGAQIVTLPEDAGLPAPSRFALLLVAAIGGLSVAVILLVNKVFSRVILRPLFGVMRMLNGENMNDALGKRPDEFGFIARRIKDLRDQH